MNCLRVNIDPQLTIVVTQVALVTFVVLFYVKILLYVFYKYSKHGSPAVNVRDPKGPGVCFGELALLYNAPRNATVIASQQSVLW